MSAVASAAGSYEQASFLLLSPRTAPAAILIAGPSTPLYAARSSLRFSVYPLSPPEQRVVERAPVGLRVINNVPPKLGPPPLFLLPPVCKGEGVLFARQVYFPPSPSLAMASSPQTGPSLNHISSPMFTTYEPSSSSAPSCTSTRNTSPDSPHHSANSQPNSTIIPPPPCGLLESPQLFPNMDNNNNNSNNNNNNPFGTVNDHRSKIMFERLGHAPNNDLRDPIPTSNPRHLPSRSFTSANWRTPGSGMNDPSLPLAQAHGTPFPNPLASPPLNGYGSYTSGPPSTSGAGTSDYVTISRSVSQLHLADNDQDETYAYCFDRGNGQFTRLVPADMLPPLLDVPALQQGCAGMKVLPVPRGLAPNGHSSNSERVDLQVWWRTEVVSYKMTPYANS